MNLKKLKNILSKPAYEKVKPIETAIEKHNLSVYGETIDSVSTGDLVFHIVDEKNKIMMSRLTPGANIGYHTHEMNSEIIYILSGVGHFEYDDQVEKVKAGDVHYCPMGHSHAFYNDGDDDLAYFAIVAEHH